MGSQWQALHGSGQLHIEAATDRTKLRTKEVVKPPKSAPFTWQGKSLPSSPERRQFVPALTPATA